MSKEEVINIALRKLGTNHIDLLDGMTIRIRNNFYNIYVENGNISVEEI